jgi:predicted nucleic acid-binding protein
MRFVLDSSIAVKWVIAEADTSQAIQVRDDFRRGIHELLAPDAFVLEVAHAIAKAERQGRINSGDGVQFLTDVLSTLPDLHPTLPLLARAFDIATAARIGIYDCLYVALAEREACDFITADDRLVRTLQPQFPFIKSLVTLP